jgi:hypothetical protein
MWTAHWLKALQQHQRVYQKPRSAWNTLLSTEKFFPSLGSSFSCSNRFFASIAIFCRVRIVLFAVAIRLRIMRAGLALTGVPKSRVGEGFAATHVTRRSEGEGYCMKKRSEGRQRIAAAATIFTLVGTFSGGLSATAAPKASVAGFAYRDTSGEERDQTAAHAAFLKGFAEDLRSRLSATYRVVPLECAESCLSLEDDAGALLDYARRAGADYLVSGGFRKMSTLEQWAKIIVLDVRTGQPVYDRLFSFRGDNEEAWRRAAAFVARELGSLSKTPSE